jgi:hypothetical protein
VDDPSTYHLIISSCGRLSLRRRSQLDGLRHLFFGVPSLDHDQALDVLVAVRHFLDEGHFATGLDPWTYKTACRLIQTMEEEAPLARALREELGDAFRAAILQFVQEHKLSRAILLEEDVRQAWTAAKRPNDILDLLGCLELRVSGSAAHYPVFIYGGDFVPKRALRVLEYLAKNLGADLSYIEGLPCRDRNDLDRDIDPKVDALLRAWDPSLRTAVRKHVDEALYQDGELILDAYKTLIYPSSCHLRVEPGLVQLSQQLTWKVQPWSGGEGGFVFICDLEMNFDPEIELCRSVSSRFHAPEFSRAESEIFSGVVNGVLQKNFHFVY